jgi:hypothetical protein
MKTTLVIVLIFLILGVASVAVSVIENASVSIILFQLGYLILVSSFGYITWKKYRSI